MAFSSKKDRRPFPFGAFLRKFDWMNAPVSECTKGGNALVDPRPERKVLTSFEDQIPHDQTRHQVKPGIIGHICYSYGAGVRDARHTRLYALALEHSTRSLYPLDYRY